MPYGAPINGRVKDTSLQYNEYVVYDVSQVQITHVLRLKWNFG